MDIVMETSRGGIAMEIPLTTTTITTTSSSSFKKTPPTRLAKRLSQQTPCVPSLQHIQAKLLHAHLRRQQFYESLSRKARPKPRSPSQSSLDDDADPAQRLEAKLQAAEQKRLSLLEKAKKRLAWLDELRQAAKFGVEMRFQREREKLGSKVESRVQQAEANRMLLLKAHRQRRASIKERSSQSIYRRIARESKYKERVRASINQKRAAAEKKRLALLEAEKKKATARMLQVQQVATSVSHQREIERRRLSDMLESRLQKAKRRRAELLRQRGKRQNSGMVNRQKLHKQADLLSRKLARCWRNFLKLKKTTVDLAKDYQALKISEESVKSMPFEHLAMLIESTATLQTAKDLLDRLESRIKVYKVVAPTSQASSLSNIDHLLKRVATPKRRPTSRIPRTSTKSRVEKKSGSVKEVSRRPATLSRYPVRVVLCAYMILGHPDAVLSGLGEREIALAKSAEAFVRELELLVTLILEGPAQSVNRESDCMLSDRRTFRSQLAVFDKAWCSYLNCFVMWKVKDARLLEEDLVRAACQLELSMIQKCRMTPDGDTGSLTHDMKAIQKQVTEDQILLKEKIFHLSGEAGIQHMESALSETRSKYFQAKDNGSPLGTPVTQISSPSLPSASAGPSVRLDTEGILPEGCERPSRVVRALFKEDDSLPTKNSDPAPSSFIDGQLGAAAEKLATENEMIVNEFLHEQGYTLADSSCDGDKSQASIKTFQENIRKTMEEAFWDGIIESVKQDVPNFDRIVQLVKEVRDEISDVAPESWKQDIFDIIDLDVLSQVLKSGNLDITYLGNILEFSLSTIQKLSSPAVEDSITSSHQTFLKELVDICSASYQSKHSSVIALIKGVRFVLEQIQALKLEISKARIRIMEPLLRGPSGFDYLRGAFMKRYGNPGEASTSLPLTLQWLSSVQMSKDQQWEEHVSHLSALTCEDSSSQNFIPPSRLKTGGNFMVKSKQSGTSPTAATNGDQPECNGEKVDLMVRLGLLKLVSGVAGLTNETLPETLHLNLHRLRVVQAEIQKVVVISTSILVLRQLILSEQVVSTPADMDSALSKCTERLLNLLDHVEGIGIQDIVETISVFLVDDLKVEDNKLKIAKTIMNSMLGKSLKAGDAVFEKVSLAVYLAAQGVVLGGSGVKGRNLAEIALRPIGAVSQTDMVVKASEILIGAATVSIRVHGPWYTCLTSAF